MDNNDNITVAAIFDTDAQAHIAVGVLESNGINAIIDNEIVSTLLPFVSSGYRVLVNTRDLEKAAEIISRLDFDKM